LAQATLKPAKLNAEDVSLAAQPTDDGYSGAEGLGEGPRQRGRLPWVCQDSSVLKLFAVLSKVESLHIGITISLAPTS
jgi:hypothetical protein